MSKTITKCIGKNPYLLEQKVCVFADFVRFMIESALPIRNSQKHRLNLLDMLGSFENKKFLFLIESAFPKRNSQKHRLNVLDMLGSFENTKFLFLSICTFPKRNSQNMSILPYICLRRTSTFASTLVSVFVDFSVL